MPVLDSSLQSTVMPVGSHVTTQLAMPCNKMDSITITVSAMTAANMWVGIGVSDDQMMVSIGYAS